jgi:hypothetical protein
MKNLVQYQLTEKERITYINGDKDSADLFSLLADGNDTGEIDGIDNALDLIGLSGKRGDSLYAAIEYISKNSKQPRNSTDAYQPWLAYLKKRVPPSWNLEKVSND